MLNITPAVEKNSVKLQGTAALQQHPKTVSVLLPTCKVHFDDESSNTGLEEPTLNVKFVHCNFVSQVQSKV